MKKAEINIKYEVLIKNFLFFQNANTCHGSKKNQNFFLKYDYEFYLVFNKK